MRKKTSIDRRETQEVLSGDLKYTNALVPDWHNCALVAQLLHSSALVYLKTGSPSEWRDHEHETKHALMTAILQPSRCVGMHACARVRTESGIVCDSYTSQRATELGQRKGRMIFQTVGGADYQEKLTTPPVVMVICDSNVYNI